VSAPKPWPRAGNDREVEKVFRPDGSPAFEWFVSSRSTPGAYRLVKFGQAGAVRWWTCSCPAGWGGHQKMGSQFERACAHVNAVLAAEKDEGYPPRPSAPANVSALVD
jgi:hypothetical protein